MRCVFKVMLVMVILSMTMLVILSDRVAGQAGAAGNGYPETYWSKMGKTGSVTGKVYKSMTGSAGVSGAYVAIVNASNPGQEYAHTTSASDGSYSFTGVSATYSSIQRKGPDGTEGSYDYERWMYKVLAKMGSGGEPRYSSSFGIDADQAGPTTTSVVLPVEDATATPTPSASATATATSNPSANGNSPSPSGPTSVLASAQQTPTPGASITQAPGSSTVVAQEPTPGTGPAGAPTPAPSNGSMQLVMILVALIAIAVMVVAAAIFLIVRFR